MLWGLFSSFSLELFPQPVLKASSSWPTEGGPLTLTCQTQLAPQRSDVQLWFRFFRDGQTLESRWSNSPEFQITAVWSRDSGSYWCQAKRVTSRAGKMSQELQINVKSKCRWVLRFAGTGARKNQAKLQIKNLFFCQPTKVQPLLVLVPYCYPTNLPFYLLPAFSSSHLC